jgi:hypothetical protein
MSHLDICNTSYDKKKGRKSNCHQKSGINPTLVCASEVQHTVGKLSTRATTFLQTSSWSEVYTRSYALSKLRESQVLKFRDSHLGVQGQKAIQMWPPWRGAKYNIWGKVVASLESGPWWVISIVSLESHMAYPSTKGALESELTTLCLVKCICKWITRSLSLFLVPS